MQTGAVPEPGPAEPPLPPTTPPTGARPIPGKAAVPVVKAPAGPVAPGEEIVAERTEGSKSFATATPGEFKTQVFTGPVHFRNTTTGKWDEIDTTLVDGTAGRLRNKAGAATIDLAKQVGGATLARLVVDDSHSVGFSLVSSRPATGRVDKNTVTYPSVLANVDLDLTVRPDGLKEDIVVRSRTAPDRFVYELALQNLTARVNGAGAVVHEDASGTERAITPPGSMTDATWDPVRPLAGRSEAVAYSVATVAGKTLLTVAADRTWLDAATLPVRIDPQLFVSTGEADDTYIWYPAGYAPSDRSYERYLAAGSSDGTHTTRAYMHFNLAQLNNKAITAATFNIFQASSVSCTAYNYSLYRVTQGWDGRTMTGAPGATTADWVGAATMGCESTWRTMNVTTAVRNWTSGAWGQFGLSLQAEGEYDPSTLRIFNAWDFSGCVCDIPHIDITWNNPPAMATPLAPANGANFHTLTPTLSVGASDPDGDALQYYFRVSRYVGPGNGDDAETNVVYNSGWIGASSIALPAGVLAWNASYTWHVYTSDGFAVTGPTWVWWFAPVNTAPAVANPLAPANGASLHNLTPTLSVSSSDPDGDAVQYYYRVARNVRPGNGDDAESNVVYNSGWVSGSSNAVPAGVLVWDATYTWHVYTYDGIAQTNPNWVWSFTTVNNAPNVALAIPEAGAVSATTTPTLSATATDPDGAGDNPLEYAFKISTDADLGGTVFQSGWSQSPSGPCPPACWPTGAATTGRPRPATATPSLRRSPRRPGRCRSTCASGSAPHCPTTPRAGVGEPGHRQRGGVVLVADGGQRGRPPRRDLRLQLPGRPVGRPRRGVF